ncbi:MAG: hypothetical protein ACJ71J_14300 [Nitrososphaeraceae archaeon]
MSLLLAADDGCVDDAAAVPDEPLENAAAAALETASNVGFTSS